MTLRKWGQWLKGGRKKQARLSRPARWPQAVPRLEVLEDRSLPATLTYVPISTGIATGFTYVTPVQGDLDGDGDLDAIVGERYGTFLFFENTGNATAPAFVERTGAANPLDGLDVGKHSKPALGDLDGDGDLDLVSGTSNGKFRFFENTGSAIAPAFVQRTGAANPLDGFDVGDYSAPALGDIDRDGDLDLVSGAKNGKFFLALNTGSAIAPAFGAPFDLTPLGATDVGKYSVPALADLDGDGDLDLVAGTSDGTFRYFEFNSATGFVEQTGAANPLNGFDVGKYAVPALADFDQDGDFDVFGGTKKGTFDLFECSRT